MEYLELQIVRIHQSQSRVQTSPLNSTNSRRLSFPLGVITIETTINAVA